MSTDWMDVSVPLRTGMVHWPDNPPVKIERVMDLEQGDAASVSSMGLARVVEIRDPVSIKRAELEPAKLQPGERVLFRTRNSERCWQTDAFVEDFVFISRDAAHRGRRWRPRPGCAAAPSWGPIALRCSSQSR